MFLVMDRSDLSSRVHAVGYEEIQTISGHTIVLLGNGLNHQTPFAQKHLLRSKVIRNINNSMLQIADDHDNDCNKAINESLLKQWCEDVLASSDDDEEVRY